MARTLKQYITHLTRYGSEGILAAAQRDLSEAELVELERLVKASKRRPKAKRG